MAKTYAEDRGMGRGGGVISSFSLNYKKLAKEENVFDSANHLFDIGIDKISAFELLSPNVSNKANDIIRDLIANGFDCVEISDFAMDCPFTEYQAFCILDSTIITLIGSEFLS